MHGRNEKSTALRNAARRIRGRIRRLEPWARPARHVHGSRKVIVARRKPSSSSAV